MLLADDGDARVGQQHAVVDRGDRDADAVAVLEERLPARDARQVESAPFQQVVQLFAAARRVGREQHPAVEVVKEAHQGGRRVFIARLDLHGGGQSRCEVAHALAIGDGLRGVANGRECRQACHDVGRRDERLGDAEDRSFRVEAAQFEALAGFRVKLLEQRLVPGREYEHAAVRQVVDQRRGLVEEQRQVILDAAVGDAVGDVAIDPGLRRLAFETLAVAVAEVADGRSIERHLARRQDLDPLHGVARHLGIRGEVFQRLDFVVEEVDAQRRIGAHREQVDQRPAHGEFTVLRDLRHAQVAGVDERIDERLAGQRLAVLQRQGPGGDVVDRRQSLLQCGDGGDDDAAPQSAERGQHAQPLGDDVLVRGEAVPGERLPLDEMLDRTGVAGEEAQLGLELVRVPRVLGQQEQRAVHACGKFGHGQRRAGADEPAPVGGLAGLRQGMAGWDQDCGVQRGARRNRAAIIT